MVYRLPESLRGHFQKPFGPVLQTKDLKDHVRPFDLLVCVGDFVSRTAIEEGFHPQMIVVDYKTKRDDVDPELKERLSHYGKTVLRVRNEAGTVSNELYLAVVQGLRMKGPVRVEVEGEEDLAGLPVFAEAPLGSVVLYGMPDQGVVYVRVDERMRTESKRLLDAMRV